MIAKYQLTIDVVYCADDQQGLDACRRKLDGLAERASSEGLLSSDHHDCFVVEVDSFLKPADLTREELEELYGDAASTCGPKGAGERRFRRIGAWTAIRTFMASSPTGTSTSMKRHENNS